MTETSEKDLVAELLAGDGRVGDIRQTMGSISKTYDHLHLLCRRLQRDFERLVGSDNVGVTLHESAWGAYFVANFSLPTNPKNEIAHIESRLRSVLFGVLGHATEIRFDSKAGKAAFHISTEFGHTHHQLPTIGGPKPGYGDEVDDGE